MKLFEAVLSCFWLPFGRRTFYGGLLRYNYYIATGLGEVKGASNETDGIPETAVAPINPEWVENVGPGASRSP